MTDELTELAIKYSMAVFPQVPRWVAEEHIRVLRPGGLFSSAKRAYLKWPKVRIKYYDLTWPYDPKCDYHRVFLVK